MILQQSYANDIESHNVFYTVKLEQNQKVAKPFASVVNIVIILDCDNAYLTQYQKY